MSNFGIKLFEVIDTVAFFAALPFFYLEKLRFPNATFNAL